MFTLLGLIYYSAMGLLTILAAMSPWIVLILVIFLFIVWIGE